VRLRTLLERMGLSFDLVPRRIENKGDVEELIASISGQKLTIGVTHSTDKSGEQRENVEYREPRGSDEQVEAASTPAPRGGGKGKPAPAKGKGARR
jgi:hypothetical protein